MTKKEKILKIKQEHPEWGCRKIAKKVGCAPQYAAAVLKEENLKIPEEKKEFNEEKLIKEIIKKLENGESITEEDLIKEYEIDIKTAVKIITIATNQYNQKEEEKRQLIEKHIKRIQKKEDEETIKQNILYELLSNSVKRFEPPIINYQKPKRFLKKSLTAVACFSDWHIGEIVVPEHVDGINAFDEQIAAARIELLVEKIIEIVELQRTHSNVDRLIVWLGGDMVSGLIHEELRKNANLGEIKQVGLAGYLIAQALAELSMNFEEIKVITSVGNHGRLDKKKEAKNPYNSFDYISYQIAALSLQKYKNIKWDISSSMLKYEDIDEWVFVFSHGDEIKSWSSIPWYGMERSFRAKQSMFLYKQTLSDYKGLVKPLHYMVVGHFHTGAEIPSGHGKIFINGSIKGIDEYSYKNGWMSRPSQKLLFIDKKHGVVDNRDIWLDVDKGITGEVERYNYEIPDVWSEFLQRL
ncbi:MAG: hypothetical protein D6834_00615 [Aquificota bacterium]|nr:MAG: hypothetical protein D6834_00615 [Aquificota bacterium]